jgi:hypothetical protein
MSVVDKGLHAQAATLGLAVNCNRALPAPKEARGTKVSMGAERALV